MTSFRHALDHAMLMPFFSAISNSTALSYHQQAPRRRLTRHEICIQMTLLSPCLHSFNLMGFISAEIQALVNPRGLCMRVCGVCVCACGLATRVKYGLIQLLIQVSPYTLLL